MPKSIRIQVAQLLAITLFAVSQSCFSQSLNDKNWVGVSIDNNQYGSVIKYTFDNALDPSSPAITTSFERYIMRNFDAGILLTVGMVGGFNNQEVNILQLALRTKYKLPIIQSPEIGTRANLFFAADFGALNYKELSLRDTASIQFSISPTVGGAYHINDDFKVTVSATYNINPDFRYRAYRIGLGRSVQSNKDTDNDGVPDKKDACRTQPGPSRFQGCLRAPGG